MDAFSLIHLLLKCPQLKDELVNSYVEVTVKAVHVFSVFIIKIR